MSKPVPHIIQSDIIEERYARGWHCLGLAKDFTDKPTKLEYFGTKMVAYRGEDEAVHILDAYCPHMGADLSLGKVEGNSIRCPFHHWSWGADGVCDDIPYADKIPAKACITSYQVLERNQLLFVWYDPEGKAPLAQEQPPVIDDCYSDEWTDWRVELIPINTNCRELVDNMADSAHFGPVHGAPITKFQNIVEGHTYTQELWSSSELLAEDGELYSRATYYGPAYMNTYMSGKIGGMDVESRLLVTHVPISTESFDLRFGVMVKKNPNLTDAENSAMVEEYVKQNHTAFFQDVDIWHSKVRVDNPVLCDGDGPVHRLRRWYSQFYVNRADVPAGLAERKVYEVEQKGRKQNSLEPA